MSVPLLDVNAQYAPIRAEVDAAVAGVFDSGKFILGAEVKELEGKIAGVAGVPFAVACASGTDAILLSLMALGVEAGDEVITTPYTFFATAGCISRLGAKPVFVDIDERSYNIDPAGIEEKITGRTRAIEPVHLYGQVARMEEILSIAEERGIPVIEDACQAIGARRNRKPAGSFGATACFSFFPSKNLGCAGDGGMVTVRDEALAGKIRILREHGASPKYYHSRVGLNSRLDTLQAALLLVKVRYLEKWTEGRRKNAAFYNEALEGLPVVTPHVEAGNDHIYNQYVIRVERRDALVNHLKKRGIGHALYYPVPLHLQECYRDLGYREGHLPNAERAARETVAIPVYPELTEAQREEVVEAVRSFYTE